MRDNRQYIISASTVARSLREYAQENRLSNQELTTCIARLTASSLEVHNVKRFLNGSVNKPTDLDVYIEFLAHSHINKIDNAVLTHGMMPFPKTVHDFIFGEGYKDKTFKTAQFERTYSLKDDGAKKFLYLRKRQGENYVHVIESKKIGKVRENLLGQGWCLYTSSGQPIFILHTLRGTKIISAFSSLTDSFGLPAHSLVVSYLLTGASSVDDPKVPLSTVASDSLAQAFRFTGEPRFNTSKRVNDLLGRLRYSKDTSEIKAETEEKYFEQLKLRNQRLLDATSAHEISRVPERLRMTPDDYAREYIFYIRAHDEMIDGPYDEQKALDLVSKANCDYADEDGKTVLMWCVDCGSRAELLTLLRAGCDTNAQDSRGWTASHYNILNRRIAEGHEWPTRSFDVLEKLLAHLETKQAKANGTFMEMPDWFYDAPEPD